MARPFMAMLSASFCFPIPTICPISCNSNQIRHSVSKLRHGSLSPLANFGMPRMAAV